MPLTKREWTQLKTALETSASLSTVGMFGEPGQSVRVMPRQNVLAILETYLEETPLPEAPPASVRPPQGKKQHHPDCKAVSVLNRKLASDISCDCGRNP
jgi:hypothetical protein